MRDNEVDPAVRRPEDNMLVEHKLENSRLVRVLKWLLTKSLPTHGAWLPGDRTPLFTGQGNIPKICFDRNIRTVAINLQMKF